MLRSGVHWMAILTYANLEVSVAGLFKYVWTFSGLQALKDKEINSIDLFQSFKGSYWKWKSNKKTNERATEAEDSGRQKNLLDTTACKIAIKPVSRTLFFLFWLFLWYLAMLSSFHWFFPDFISLAFSNLIILLHNRINVFNLGRQKSKYFSTHLP